MSKLNSWYVRIPVKKDPSKTVKYWRDDNGRIIFFKTLGEAEVRAAWLGTRWCASIGTKDDMYANPK